MATVKGVWVWVDYFSFEYMDIDESVNFSSNGKSFTKLLISMYDSGTPPITEIINIRYINDSETIKVYRNNSWQNEAYKTIDFGTTEQTVSEDFYSFLASHATQQAASVPTPDWANCFVKTVSGNKAVEKVWIKQNGQLVKIFGEDTPTASVIGFTGLTNSSGALTWTDDIASLQSSAPYTTTTSGNYVSVTGALDSYFPYNQITEVEDGNGNTFIRFPKCYIKWTNDSSGNIDGFQVSNAQIDSDYFIPDCFLNPNSVDGTDSYLDYVDIGKYEASGDSSMAYSRSGYSPLASIMKGVFRTRCRAYGSSTNYYNGYQLLDIQMYTLYNFLCMMYYRTSNIQNVYAGRTATTNTSTSVTGSTDGVTGLNGWNTSTTCVKMLGVENPYGNIGKWCDGVYFSDTTIYIHRFPTQYNNSSTNGYESGFSRPDSGNYIKNLKMGQTKETRSAVYSCTTGGSSTTYVGDYCYYSSVGTLLLAGGHWRGGSNAGLWCLNGEVDGVSVGAGIGGRLCRRPM